MITLSLKEKNETEVLLDASVSKLINSVELTGDLLKLNFKDHPASKPLAIEITDAFCCDMEEAKVEFEKNKTLSIKNAHYRVDKDNIILYRKEYSIIVS